MRSVAGRPARRKTRGYMAHEGGRFPEETLCIPAVFVLGSRRRFGNYAIFLCYQIRHAIYRIALEFGWETPGGSLNPPRPGESAEIFSRADEYSNARQRRQ